MRGGSTTAPMAVRPIADRWAVLQCAVPMAVRRLADLMAAPLIVHPVAAPTIMGAPTTTVAAITAARLSITGRPSSPRAMVMEELQWLGRLWPALQSAPPLRLRPLRRHRRTIIPRRPIISPTLGRATEASIAARRIDPVKKRAAVFEAANVVEDDRGSGCGICKSGDVWCNDHARVVPKRMIGR